jgi:hypothetical protein
LVETLSRRERWQKSNYIATLLPTVRPRTAGVTTDRLASGRLTKIRTHDLQFRLVETTFTLHSHTLPPELSYIQRTALNCIKSKKPYTLARFEPTILLSVGADDDHLTRPPGVSFESGYEPIGKILPCLSWRLAHSVCA